MRAPTIVPIRMDMRIIIVRNYRPTFSFSAYELQPHLTPPSAQKFAPLSPSSALQSANNATLRQVRYFPTSPGTPCPSDSAQQ